jgi:hypothetical protein
MRAHIEACPTASIRSEAPMDSDGIVPEPLWVRPDLGYGAATCTWIFAQQPGLPGSASTRLATTISAALIGVRVFPDVPMNAGCLP